MSKKYDIFLDCNKIGTTEFEKADVPMGVVFGILNFTEPISGYAFFKQYCIEKSITIVAEFSEEKIIETSTIPGLVVINESGLQINGIGNQISGMDADVFFIMIYGISFPFYEEEFPLHVKAYNEKL